MPRACQIDGSFTCCWDLSKPNPVFPQSLIVAYVGLVAQMVKNLPAMRETWVRSLDWEDPLAKEMATYSRIVAWKVSWTEEPVGLQSMGSQRVGHD